ncbi:hypothetical protein [Streptomyces sp. NPDC057403]|uniref:hypothetical protein n=1 Tax=Streptomyces sp. NPDC057403 TaxID=3346119 RepID=UPI003682CE14
MRTFGPLYGARLARGPVTASSSARVWAAVQASTGAGDVAAEHCVDRRERARQARADGIDAGMPPAVTA